MLDVIVVITCEARKQVQNGRDRSGCFGIAKTHGDELPVVAVKLENVVAAHRRVQREAHEALGEILFEEPSAASSLTHGVHDALVP